MSCIDDVLEDGDLGLGFGLKPGSLMKPEDINNKRILLFKRFEEKDNGRLISKDFHDKENVKSRADPMKRSNLLSALLDSGQFLGRRSGSLFRKRDFAYDQEIDLLSYELDSVRKQLLSKQQAIKILQQQLKYANLQNEHLENKIKWVHGTLIKDFNHLQFSMERERLVTSEGREMLLVKIDHLEAENKCLKWAVNEMNNHKNHKNFENISPMNNGLINESDQIFKEDDHHHHHVDDGCTCHCSDYYGTCSCYEYANELVKILHHLTKELQDVKTNHNHQNESLKISHKSLPECWRSEISKSIVPVFSKNSIPHSNSSKTEPTTDHESTTDTFASDKETNCKTVNYLHNDH